MSHFGLPVAGQHYPLSIGKANDAEPSSTRKELTTMFTLKINPILASDSYKLSHAFSYAKNVIGMFSYIEPRTRGLHIIIPFGLHMWMKKFLTIQITMEMVDEAEAFAAAHGEPFKREGWEKVVNVYDGYLPVTIRAVPEGTPVRSGNALVTIECTDPDLFWLSSYLETALQRGVWYPTTIASMDYDIKREIKRFYEISGADMGLLPFALHDFGGRGVSCAEQAEIGGAAHLVNFMGSDTMEGIRAANFYYKHPMAAFSVPATEHSVECSFGGTDENEIEYLRHVLKNLAKPGGIVSIVIDGYDVYRAATTLCTTLRDEIVACGAKVVFRPDSGDMMEVVPRLLRLQERAFGSVTNAKGYRKINTVGIIQGDGVDHMAIKTLLGNILAMGFSADNVIFGSGGALLQKVNRDTFKFAQKASAILVTKSVPAFDGEQHYSIETDEWVGISKDPITDPGKASKKGRLTLARSLVTGELMTVCIDNGLDVEFEDVMQTVYHNGQILVETTLAEVRARCAI
jgi:nicotinamide phosphoribosyltransferase